LKYTDPTGLDPRFLNPNNLFSGWSGASPSIERRLQDIWWTQARIDAAWAQWRAGNKPVISDYGEYLVSKFNSSAREVARAELPTTIITAVSVAIVPIAEQAAIEATISTAPRTLESPAEVGIRTPHGIAQQANTAKALEALNRVQSGAPVYKQGQFGVQYVEEAQFWSLTNPKVTADYAKGVGMPGEGNNPDWVMSGTVKPSSPVITRPAPGIGANTGGSMEAVVPEKGVQIDWFSTK
jgi:hypothetical protein